MHCFAEKSTDDFTSRTIEVSYTGEDIVVAAADRTEKNSGFVDYHNAFKCCWTVILFKLDRGRRGKCCFP